MAKFSFNGMDEIAASFEDMVQLSDEDRLSVIMPAAEVLVKRQREKIEQTFTQRSGALADSLSIREKSDDDGAYANIYLKGKHPGSSTGKRKGKRRSNGKYSGTNAEVGYVLEHGSPRIAATHWMENANEDAAAEIADVQQDAWNALLEKKGL